MSKYPNTLGRIEAVWNKLGGEAGVDRFLRGELVVSEAPKKWHKENGDIYFSVVSDGTEGVDWITRLENKGFLLTDETEQILRSPDFKPTQGLTTEVIVLKGNTFEDVERTSEYIRTEAVHYRLQIPNAELACLICHKFSGDEIAQMGLTWIVTMHEPIRDGNGLPRLLSAGRDEDGRQLNACSGRPDHRWLRDDGFAFVLSTAPITKTEK